MERARVDASSACEREPEDYPMFRIIRVPPALDKCFQPVAWHVPGNHVTYLRWLVVTMACMWGRHHVANVYRYLDAPSHRTRVNTFCLVQRWAPEAVLRSGSGPPPGAALGRFGRLAAGEAP